MIIHHPMKRLARFGLVKGELQLKLFWRICPFMCKLISWSKLNRVILSLDLHTTEGIGVKLLYWCQFSHLLNYMGHVQPMEWPFSPSSSKTNSKLNLYPAWSAWRESPHLRLQCWGSINIPLSFYFFNRSLCSFPFLLRPFNAINRFQ